MLMLILFGRFSQMLKFMKRLANQRTRKKCHACGNPDRVPMNQTISQHFTNPNDEWRREQPGQGVWPSNSRISSLEYRYAGKTGFADNLAHKTASRAKDPTGRNLID